VSAQSGSAEQELPKGAGPSFSRLRWALLALVSLAFVINFLDRQVLSVLAPTIRHELGLSTSQYGVIVFCFLLGMAAFQVPNGLLMDRAGTRRGFSIIVPFWSLASFLHSAARSVLQFSVLRFCLGAAECGNYTGGLKLIAQRFPTRERGLAGGIFNSCTFVGSIVAPLIVTWLALRYSWRTAFMVASSSGFLWVLIWRLVYPRELDREALTPGAQIGKSAESTIPLRLILKHRQTWGLILLRSLTGPLSHLYWFWLPEYLSSARGLSLEEMGRVVWIPYLCGGLGNVFSGLLAGELQKRGRGVDFSRRFPLFAGCVIVAAANLIVYFAPDVPLAIALLSIANFGANMIEPSFIGYFGDFFPPEVVGRVTSLTGVGDNLTSMLLMLSTGIVLDRYSYLPVFTMAGILPLIIIANVVFVLGKVRKVDLYR
jgi:ACS family hexuronate transporter-like MFS transporter